VEIGVGGGGVVLALFNGTELGYIPLTCVISERII